MRNRPRGELGCPQPPRKEIAEVDSHPQRPSSKVQVLRIHPGAAVMSNQCWLPQPPPLSPISRELAVLLLGSHVGTHKSQVLLCSGLWDYELAQEKRAVSIFLLSEQAGSWSRRSKGAWRLRALQSQARALFPNLICTHVPLHSNS